MFVVLLGFFVMIATGFAMFVQARTKEPYSMIGTILQILMFIGAAIVAIGDILK